MEYNLDVNYEGRPAYQIQIYDNFNKLKDFFLDKSNRGYAKVCIVSDSRVADIYIDSVRQIIAESGLQVNEFIFPAGEASKNIDVCQKLYEELITNHFDRQDLLLALGGGVVGDLTGFCAATYLRGIDFIQVPTSLLAFADSSIGGKTGVDFKAYKNMVGAFHMPKLVYMNTLVLNTLDDTQFSCGMAEIIKHGLIRDKEYYTWLIDNKEAIKAKKGDVLAEMIYRSCNIKREVVQLDPKEQNIRAYLNFGHTLGHAIEKLADFKLNHGQCVALGMVCALRLSLRDGYISQSDMDLALDLLKYFDLKTNLNNISDISSFDADTIIKTSKSDKKMIGNKVKFIILKGIGNAAINTEYTDEDLNFALEAVL